ncbi:MAG: AraC family transcriptional regulator [Stellaceae bacterium]
MELGYGDEKFPTGCLLESSVERNWHGLFVERRSHPRGDLPTFVLKYSEVALLLKGPTIVTRQADAIYQRTPGTRGAIWLGQAGVREDFVSFSQGEAEMLHIYLPERPFAILEADDDLQKFSAASLRYEAGFYDPLLEQIAEVILSEMRMETSCGGLLIDALSTSLVARLLQGYSNLSPKPIDASVVRKGLDRRRLRRVQAFIEAHLEEDITVADLASTACLSRFHFARAFKTATGKSPHKYIGDKRLDLAKSHLAGDDRSLADIAATCRFSSQANFSRAFRRATGQTPGQYRALVALCC